MEPPTLNIRRGLLTAGLSGVAGALVPAALVIAYIVFRQSNRDFVPSTKFHDFLADLVEYWPYPVCGGAVFLGSAAWATFAPPGSWGFARSLFIIFVVSVILWFLTG